MTLLKSVLDQNRIPSPHRGEFYIDYETLLKPVTAPTYTPLPPLDLSNLTDFEMPNVNYQVSLLSYLGLN